MDIYLVQDFTKILKVYHDFMFVNWIIMKKIPILNAKNKPNK